MLTNQPEGDKLIREALGEGVALVDYVKPGFKLAKAVIAAYDAQPRMPRPGVDAARHHDLGRDGARSLFRHDRSGHARGGVRRAARFQAPRGGHAGIAGRRGKAPRDRRARGARTAGATERRP